MKTTASTGATIPAKARREKGRALPNKQCLQCGGAYYAAPAHYMQRRYCSNTCRAIAGGYDAMPQDIAARAPKCGEPGFIGSIPQALALVEAQLAVADAIQRGTLAIERDVLREILREQRAHQRQQEAG